MAGLFWCSLVSLLVLAKALTFDLANPNIRNDSEACGNLICLEKYTTEGGNGSSSVSILYLKINRVGHGTLRQHLHEIASVTSAHPKKVFDPSGVVTHGQISGGKAELRLRFTKDEDCEAEYSCESFAAGSGGSKHLRSAQIQGQNNDEATKQLVQVIKQLGHELSWVKTSLGFLKQRVDRLKWSVLIKSHQINHNAEQLRAHTQNSTETYTTLIHNVSTSLVHTLQGELRTLSNDMNVSAVKTRKLLRKSALPESTTLMSEIQSMFIEAHRPPKCLKGMISFLRYTIIEPSKKNEPNSFPFPCETDSDGGGWIIFQRRKNGDVDFYRGWEEYKHGFGSFSGDFWLGNEKIHSLTHGKKYELRIDLTHRGTDYFAQYDEFSLGDEQSRYALHVSGYHGTSGDALSIYHNNMPFSTYDKNYPKARDNCAHDCHGAWWYKECHTSNLNGKWKSTKFSDTLRWSRLTDKKDPPYVSYTEMKMRLRE